MHHYIRRMDFYSLGRAHALEKFGADGYTAQSDETVKKKITFRGLNVHLDQPAGSTRTWKYDDGRPSFTARYPHDYGFFPGVEAADGDDLDVYVGPHKASNTVFVLDKLKRDGKSFDEHKVFVGFNSASQIKKDILDDWAMQQAVGPMRKMPFGALKALIQAKKFKAPAGKPLGPGKS